MPDHALSPALSARLRGNLRAAVASGAPKGELAQALLVLKGFSATLRSLLGTDQKESPLIRFVKKQASPKAGELAQDIGLLAVKLIDSLIHDLKDGKIEGPEAFSSLMGLTGNITEIVQDAQALAPPE